MPNTEGILLHSDRGYQYTSRLFKVTLEQLGIKQSMSRPGCCIDNGPMEGVWGTIKSELFRGRKSDFKDKSTAIKAINSYIEFFNQERITLKWLPLYRKYKVAINILFFTVYLTGCSSFWICSFFVHSIIKYMLYFSLSVSAASLCIFLLDWFCSSSLSDDSAD